MLQQFFLVVERRFAVGSRLFLMKSHEYGCYVHLFKRDKILWTLHCLTEHSSFRPSSRAMPLLKIIFPDIDIAKKMILQ
ncbi:hypothetical protein CEXT_475881 [Caerostris extrusa]|uniref:Uncharacterized protein n=1 Tax=Caerostris extrusa TaxID=172846 RepID=A0AAV4SJN6_CAEEX|nr:hypothetical protein CEXT_475881 [Caerostris extrusa]